MADYLLQEDGVSRIVLEDASGDILLESGGPPPPPAPQPSGGVFAVAPRRRLREKIAGRFRAPAARVTVIAYAPVLQVELAAVGVPLRSRAFAPRPEFAFHIDAARATASYWKRRTDDREHQLRQALIADLFDRDGHHARERGP